MTNRQRCRTTRATGATISDFFLGEWWIANRKLAAPLAEGPASCTWLEFEAAAKAAPILGGLGNHNTYSAPDLPGWPGFHGFSAHPDLRRVRASRPITTPPARPAARAPGAHSPG